MNINYNKAFWLVTILAIVMLIPFLGLTDFNTKGEPREAVVAYTMLEHGNWILPINNGGDIPYKPPFFHWCIAFFSLFIGHVNEFTSRLPSAISLILMTIGGFIFFAKRKDRSHPHIDSFRGASCRRELSCGYGEHRLYGGSHVPALPLVGERQAPVALARHPLHERSHTDQRARGHHPALLRDGSVHAHPKRESLGHHLATRLDCRTLTLHPVLLVLCRLSARW